MSEILQNVFQIVSGNMEDEFTQNITLGTNAEGNSVKAASCQCHSNIVDDLKARRRSGHDGSRSSDLVTILRQRYKKRGILVSYDTTGNFLLKQLVRETVQELKQLGFEDDIWFDQDEGKPRSSSSFAQRLKAAEECNAALIFLTENYFWNGPSKYEADIFLRRANAKEINPNGIPFRVLIVKNEIVFGTAELKAFPVDVDLVSLKFSIAEKASVIVGTLSEELKAYVTFTTKLYRELPGSEDSFENVGYNGKSVDTWDKSDVQDWLGSLGVRERYKLSFEENEIDGFLLESLKDEDMVEFLYVDSKVTRQKILNNLKNVLNKEKGENWDECCRSRKVRDNSVYIVADLTDAWLAEFIKADLMKSGFFVHTHESIPSLKATPLQSKSNVRYLAEASNILFIMTSSVETSHFVFEELLFAAWLDKPIITAVFNNSWPTMRFALKSIVGKQPAINFGRNQCLDGLEVLRYHMMPLRSQPRAILQHQYVQKVMNGVKPLESMLTKTTDFDTEYRPKVFLSYHWDMENKVEKIKEFLNRHGCESSTDATRPAAVSLTKSRRPQARSSWALGSSEGYIQDQMSYSDLVILCISLKYLHSDNFIKDIQLAQLHKKPVIPVMVQWCSRPLDRVHVFSKKLELCNLIDMNNNVLLRKNLPELVNIIMKVSSSK